MYDKMIEYIKVLYVEDEPMISDQISMILEDEVDEIFVASNGAEGLEIFKEHKDDIDLVITDIQMPKLNGIEMIKEIKKIVPNKPIIITTAFTESEYLVEAIKLGVDKFLQKPVDLMELIETISKSYMMSVLEQKDLSELIELQKKISSEENN
jgi:YesN/AraC family two-component response regulator